MKATLPKITNEQIADALVKVRGKVALAAQILKCNRTSLHRRIKRNATLRDIVKDATELRLDIAESKLDGAVLKGEAWAICFTLKCQGKQRGYIERQEVTGKDGGAIPLFEILSAAHAKRSKKPDE